MDEWSNGKLVEMLSVKRCDFDNQRCISSLVFLKKMELKI